MFTQKNNFQIYPVISLLAIILLTQVGCDSDDDGNNQQVASPAAVSQPIFAKPDTGIATDGRLDLIMDYVRQQNGLPAMAAIMVHDGQIIEKSAVGQRSIDSDIPVNVNDKWHIGSITKSMTSTVAALLVKNGIIRWDSAIAEVYPELVGIMRPEYQNVRLDELLSHTSGLPNNPNDINQDSFFTDQRELSVQRQELVEIVLMLSSTTTRGVYEYSNIGYIVAGAMLEKVTGSNWETLMQIHLFEPLSMLQAGFGAPDTKGNLSQPVGHKWEAGYWEPVDPTFEEISDNPPVVGPAGTVHASLDDMAAYISLHLKGLRGESVDGFLDEQEFAKLYTPFPNSDYALGWVINNQSIFHNGSNTIWYAMVIINASKNTALFVVTNSDDLEIEDSSVDKAITELVIELSTRAGAVFELSR